MTEPQTTTSLAEAYSPRANPRATVSAPVTWAELAQVAPDNFDLASVRERFAKIGDPHVAVDDVADDLKPLPEWSERDARDGQGDMPYPRENPKMPGEPKRLEPSKNRDRNMDKAR